MKAKVLILFLALAGLLPMVSKAQLTYTTNNGAITITGYTGSPTNIVIPASTNGYPVTTIAAYAFFSFSGSELVNVIIPASVTNIGPLAFYFCNYLANITVATNNPAYSSINGVLFDKNQTTLIQFPTAFVGNYVIPNTVTNIGDDAFSDAAITSITIPNSVTRIGYSEFTSCYNLTNAIIGNGVSIISLAAFEYCESLTSVVIPDSVTSIEEYAFDSCDSLTNVVIGSSVTSIGAWAFEICGSLTGITIPTSVTNIDDGAFFYCVSLTNITVAANNPAYSSINGVLFDKNQTTLIQFPTAFVGNYVIPNSVTNIGNGAFEGCSGLMNVVIPRSVTSTIDFMFSWCFSLTNITFLGNAPDPGYDLFDRVIGTVYYYYGTSGWDTTYGGLPTVELAWTPQIVSGANVQSNSFVFTIIGTNGMSPVVEASTNLVDWQPVWTNTLSGASATFTDSQWTNYPARFYRTR